MSGDGGRAGSQGRHDPRGGRPRFERPADDPPDTSRLFVAVPLPEEVRDAAGRLMEAVEGGPVDERRPGGLRWVRVEGLHLTVRFLGATPDRRIDEVAEATRAAAGATPRFPVAFGSAGAFPSPARPRAAWLAIETGAAELAMLAARVDASLEPLGWPREERPFRAHLTLARCDGVPNADAAVGRLIELARNVELGWTADRLVLYKSLLGRGPARYEALAEASLGG